MSAISRIVSGSIDLIPNFFFTTWGYATVSLLAATCIKYVLTREDLDSIPTVGYSNPILSYISAAQYIFTGQNIIEEGYRKYKGRAFKVPFMDKWTVVVSGPQMIDDIRRAPSDTLSFLGAAAETIQVDKMLGPEVRTDPYHLPIIRSQVTRNLAHLFPELLDEIKVALSDNIPIQGKSSEWIKVPVLQTSMKVVQRVSNRIFVGLPLCRDPVYGQHLMEFALTVMQGAAIINLFPRFMRSLAAKLFTNPERNIVRAMKHLEPIFRAREAESREHEGKTWDGKAEDLISWLLEEAPPSMRNLRDIAKRVLATNFASIHSTSMSISHTLLHLAQSTEWQRILREEIEPIVEDEGWTKASVGKMHKLDSFLKEALRYNGHSAVNMDRRAMKPFTFSDGTHLPTGTFVAVVALPMYHDEEFYPDPELFDPWRFYDLRKGEEGEVSRHATVTTATDYIIFGHGTQACPGRFFAVSEMKAIIAHILVSYDMKLESGVRPLNEYYHGFCVPTQTGEIMFRARQNL